MRHRALEEELVGGELALEDMTLRQADDALDILRQEDLHGDDLAGESRRELVHDRHDIADEIVALDRPVAVLQRVGRVAAEEVDDMLAGRRQRAIDDGRHHRGDEGLLRVPAVFGVVIGALEIVDVGREMHVGRIVEPGLRLVESAVARRRLGRDVDLERRREGAEAGDVGEELGREVTGCDELLEERLAVGIGDHCLRREDAAVACAHARRPSVFDDDLGDRRVGHDIETEAFSRGGNRLGDRAHAAFDEAPAAGALMLAHDVMHDDIGRARRFRAGEGADRGVVGEDRLDRVGFEPRRQELVGALGHQIDDAINFAADMAMAPEQGSGRFERFPIPLARIDRRLEEQFADDVGGLLEIGVEGGVDLGVVAREAGELSLGLLHVVAEDDVVAVIERTEEIVGRQHLEAEFAQLELGDDARVQQAHDIGEDRRAKARGDLLGHRGAADDGAPFENQGLQPGLCKIGAADEAVVSGTDDDCVILRGHCVTRPSLDRDNL